MRFAEINLFGVYVAPISLMMIGAWLVTIALRRRRQPIRLAAIRLASGSVRVCRVHHRSLVLDPARRAEVVMTITEVTAKRSNSADDPRCRPAHLSRLSRSPRQAPRREIVPFLITLAAVALAGLLGWAMWGVYMGAPWTRDATVRAYVVTMAPEVAGRIVELHVVDNKYVRKGDLLMVIDPTNYTIAVSQAEAAVQQAQASVQNIDAQMAVQQAQISATEAQLRWGEGRARVRAAAGLALPEAGEGRLGHCSE